MTTQLAESSSATLYRAQKSAVSARSGSIGATSTSPARGVLCGALDSVVRWTQ
jgi:hypothetical protein